MQNIRSYFEDILRKIKRRIVLFLFETFKGLTFPFRSNRVLIVRLDAVGDYILFRNSLSEIKKKFGGGKMKITLLGNIIFKDLAEEFDREWVNDFIWIDLKRADKNLKLSSLSLKLKFRCFDVLINPAHSRRKTYDKFFYSFGCKYLIGSSGDDVLFESLSEKLQCDGYYHKLIPSLTEFDFELFRNWTFLEGLLGESIEKRFFLPKRKSELLKANCFNIVIFPGAGLEFRRWSTENFCSLLCQIMETSPKRKIHFYVAGGAHEQALGQSIVNVVGGQHISDLTGRTSLVQLCDLIGGANLLISNETAAVHIAAAMRTPAICISNGNHFGRFNPYPVSLSIKVVTLYPNEDFEASTGSRRQQLLEECKYKSDLDINSINPDIVFAATSRLLDETAESVDIS